MSRPTHLSRRREVPTCTRLKDQCWRSTVFSSTAICPQLMMSSGWESCRTRQGRTRACPDSISVTTFGGEDGLAHPDRVTRDNAMDLGTTRSSAANINTIASRAMIRDAKLPSHVCVLPPNNLQSWRNRCFSGHLSFVWAEVFSCYEILTHISHRFGMLRKKNSDEKMAHRTDRQISRGYFLTRAS